MGWGEGSGCDSGVGGLLTQCFFCHQALDTRRTLWLPPCRCLSSWWPGVWVGDVGGELDCCKGGGVMQNPISTSYIQFSVLEPVHRTHKSKIFRLQSQFTFTCSASLPPPCCGPLSSCVPIALLVSTCRASLPRCARSWKVWSASWAPHLVATRCTSPCSNSCAIQCPTLSR